VSRVEWDASLETGHDLVDRQHRELFSIFNEVAEAPGPDSDKAELLVRLSEYVSTHFSAEEELMARSLYPADRMASHKLEHEELSSRARELVLAHRLGETQSIAPLATLLREWLGVHIDCADRDLVDHVRETGSGRVV